MSDPAEPVTPVVPQPVAASKWRRFLLLVGLPLALVASLLVTLPVVSRLWTDDGAPPGEQPAQRSANPNRAERTDAAGSAAVTDSPSVTWPAAARAEVELPADAGGHQLAAAGLPVAVGQAASGGGPEAPRTVSVEVLDRAQTEAAGVDGVLVRLARTDGVSTAAPASVQLSYATFGQAYGGDFAGRLRLVQLPQCALRTPEAAACQPTPLESTNDQMSSTVTADVPVSGESNARSVSRPGGTLIALVSGEDGPGGSYGGSSLTAAATWQSGGSTGDFSWSYPIKVPPGLGGPVPTVGLAYSSGSVDGRISSANTQPSWAGEGFDYWPGFIERKYQNCRDDGWPAYDSCWFTDNASISLNGKATELVKDDTTQQWRLRNDDGSTVEHLTGADNGDLNLNGSIDGEYWKVTTPDGTRYYFGLHKLSSPPSGSGITGMPGAPDSNATWTMPVFANNPGEPCLNSHPSNSVCEQAWRWNLDYVIDTHGNTMAYFYEKETNRYRSLTLAADRQYTRGGYVSRIEYGLRDGQTWTATAAVAQLVFTAQERCLPGSGCVKPTDYPDVPFDQECLSGTCTKPAPTFWTTKRLAKITTRVLRAGAWDDVDSWTITHSFPATGDTVGTPVLWLSQIVHTGHLGSTDVVMPPTIFDGAPMDNRVTSGPDKVRKWRVTHIYNESGGATVITYAPPDCTPTSLPASPQTNTQRCMPVWWTPPGGTEGLYWFHKYVVAEVNQVDTNGIAPDTVERYTYVGGAAWHYDEDNGLSMPEKKTWAQWRGYGLVQRRVGTVADGVTLEETRFYRGMHGDRTDPLNPALVRPASETNITDGLGGVVADDNELAGQVRERVTYASDGGAVLQRSVSDGWVSPASATSVRPWATVTARHTQVTTTRTQSKTYNSTRINKTVKTINPANGTVTLVSDLGDEVTGGDEECTRITYKPGTTYALRSERYALDCTAIPALDGNGELVSEVAGEGVIISDERNYYDGATTWSLNMPISRGDVTKVEELKAWTPSGRTYATVATIEHDVYGRGTKQWDAAGRLTQTVYTPATGGPVTQVQTIRTHNMTNFTTTVKLEVGNGAPTEQVDPNGRKTVIEYDGVGRVLRSWLPGSDPEEDAPDSEIEYLIRTDGTNAVSTRSIRPDGSYNLSIELFDGLMRPVQTQITAIGGGRTVASTFYNTRGQTIKQYGAFYDPGAPSVNYQSFAEISIPSQVRTVYDGSGRATDQVFLKYGVEQWRSKNQFDGDRITSTPPAGELPTQVTFDSQGRATELKEFTTTSLAGAYTSTKYTFNAKSQQTEIEDSAGNKWTFVYDIRGRLVETADPDQGKSRTVYDDAGTIVYAEKNIDPASDAGTKIYFEYDDLGRAVRTRVGSPSGTILTELVYDTLALGQLTSMTRFTDGAAYTTEVTGYDTAYRPTGTSITLPAAEGALAGTYTFGSSYNTDGSVDTATTPAMGDLQAETLSYTYTPEGLPLTMASELGTYVGNANYNAYGEVTKLTLGASPKRVYLNYSYEDGTARLASSWITRDGSPSNVHKDVYTYNPVGDITKVVTTATGVATDTQCYQYDGKRRLTRGYTPSSGDCTVAPTHTNLGGPAAYWTDWTYDTSGGSSQVTVGNRASQIERYVGATGTDTTTEYFYAAAGTGKAHQLNQTKVTNAGGTTWYDYAYDHAGNTIQRPTGTGAVQNLFWNPDGTLQRVEQGGTTVASYVYDAGGSRLLQKTPSGVTAYLGDTELKLASGVVTGTRHYSFGGNTIAVRDGSSLKWLGNNDQGTATVAIDATTTSNISRRRYTPFGELRGSQPAWTGSQGFVGGDNDPTGLVHLGAREYDPKLGRFISVDPVLDQGDPQQMHGYSYSNNNPVTFSDPSGMKFDSGGGEAYAAGGDDGEIVLPADLQAMLDEARRIERMSLLDIILEAGGEILKEVLGINDILNCFQKGDILACVSIVANIIPWAKIFKLPKIVKAIERAWSAVNAFWEKLKWARKIKRQVDEFMQLARTAAREAAEKAAAAARKAREEAMAAAKAAKERAEAAARKAAEKVKQAVQKEACHSFAPGTLVLLANGSAKPIEQIRTGDRVTATDPTTGQTVAKDVTARFINQDKDLTTLTTTDGSGRVATIHTTSKHQFWDATIAGWVDAGDLVVGHRLLTTVNEDADTPDTTGTTGTGQGGGSPGNRVTVTVTAVSNYLGDATMHDLTVADIHTYYVLAAATPVLVHNCTPIDVYHATDPKYVDSIRTAIDSSRFGDGTRFGPAFYVAEDAGTAMKEASAGMTLIHFKFDVCSAKVLDLTNSRMATLFKYFGSRLGDRRWTKMIGGIARVVGYDAIKFTSTRTGGINYAILGNFSSLLRLA